MFRILLVMRFWTDGYVPSTRDRNVKFTWSRLKDLKNYLVNNGINCDCKIYDFSPEKVIEDSVHIPFDKGTYMLSKKTNMIINDSKDFDYIFVFDSDAFFEVSDYSNILEILKNLQKNDLVCFDLAKLTDEHSELVIQKNHVDLSYDWSYAYSGDKSKGPLCCGHKGSFGGVYLCDLDLLRYVGGFNEEYVGWGGEDGEVLDRISQCGLFFKQKSINAFSPFHLSHFCDWGNINYSKRF